MYPDSIIFMADGKEHDARVELPGVLRTQVSNGAMLREHEGVMYQLFIDWRDGGFVARPLVRS